MTALLVVLAIIDVASAWALLQNEAYGRLVIATPGLALAARAAILSADGERTEQGVVALVFLTTAVALWLAWGSLRSL